MGESSTAAFNEKLLDLCVSEGNLESCDMVACLLNLVAFMGVRSVWVGGKNFTKSEVKNRLHDALDEALAYHFDGRRSDA